jgi:hypothetical protein
MAQLIPFEEWCEECSEYPASQRLYSNTGDPLGDYCDECGEKALRRVEKREKKH